MDLTIRFIGIILLWKLNVSNGQAGSVNVYVPDGRANTSVCGTVVKEHDAFIRVSGVSIGPNDIHNWPWVRCDEGADCKLFPLNNGDDIRITGTADGTNVTL